MNIGFLVLDADLGGHTHTAATVARSLVQRGHRVLFVVGADSRSMVLQSHDFEIVTVPSNWRGEYPELPGMLARLAAERGLDVIQTFSSVGLPELLESARDLKLPLVWTICGGPAPSNVDVPVIPAIVSLSAEVRDSTLRSLRLNPADVHLIPARIATAEVLAKVSGSAPERFAEFRRKYGLPPSSSVVLRVARVHQQYYEGILDGANAVAELRERGHDVCFVHIGFVQNRAAFDKLRRRLDALNRRFGATIAITAQDEALQALEYAGMADVVIGTGRTAFEGMLAGKPTLIVGKNGFGGAVSRETIEDIAYYNFSGRNLKRRMSPEERVHSLAEAIEEVLSDARRGRELGEFGREYVLANLDSRLAGEAYESLYREMQGRSFAHDRDIQRLRLLRLGRLVVNQIVPSRVRGGTRRWLTAWRE